MSEANDTADKGLGATRSSFIAAAEQKRKDDIASIRFAMQQVIDTFNVFSEIANPIDEAMLVAMQQIMAAFDDAVLQCESR